MRELFIVEGISAASTVRQAMHKPSQAVLATRGKMINADKHSVSRVQNNLACKDIIDVLECGFGDQCNADHLAFSSVILLTDPDIDGTHARALLVTLFARYFEPLVTANKVYVVTPPMFRIANGVDQSEHFASTQGECDDYLSNNTQLSGLSEKTNGLVANKPDAKLRQYRFGQAERDAKLSDHSAALSITRLQGIAQFSIEQCATLLLSSKSPYRFRLCHNLEQHGRNEGDSHVRSL